MSSMHGGGRFRALIEIIVPEFTRNVEQGPLESCMPSMDGGASFRARIEIDPPQM